MSWKKWHRVHGQVMHISFVCGRVLVLSSQSLAEVSGLSTQTSAALVDSEVLQGQHCVNTLR